MDSASNNENLLFRYILDNPLYYRYMDKSFFKNKDLNELMMLVRKFYEKYSETPSAAQVSAIVKEKEIDLDESFIKTVYGIELVNYDKKWIRETTEAWIMWKNLQKNLVSAFEIAKLSEVNAGNVMSVVQEIVSTIEVTKSVNFDFDSGLDFFDPAAHRQNTENRIPSGYNHVDRVTAGGYDPKTLVAYVGASNIGKCVCGDSVINIRNSGTGVCMSVTIGEFYAMLKNRN